MSEPKKLIMIGVVLIHCPFLHIDVSVLMCESCEHAGKPVEEPIVDCYWPDKP